MSRADLFMILAGRQGLPDHAWHTLLSDEQRQEWKGLKDQAQRAAFIERLKAPAEVQTSAPADETLEFPELGRIIDQAFAGFGEDLKAVLDAAQSQPIETEVEEPTMSKMNLSPSEVELIEKTRKGKEMDLTDAEAALVNARRAPRKYMLEDLEPDAFAKLSDAEKVECRRQISEVTAKATRGE